MQLAIALSVVVAAGSSTVTHDLNDRDRTELTGCWTTRDHETWTFRETGDHGLEVVRDSRDSYTRPRAISSSLMFDPATDRFAYTTVGHIHGLMMVFALDRDRARITASVFSKHDERGYFFTGTNLVLARCK